MFILPKLDSKVSLRRRVDIKGVKDGILMLSRNRYRMVLEASSINFELKSDDEQDALIDTYESFLNSLPCPLQVVVRIRELDVSKYLIDLRSRLAQESEDVYKTQMENYSEFVQDLVADSRILSRRFYVILPYSAKDDDFMTIREQLTINSDIVNRGLARLGVNTRQLSSLELLDLFHTFYNPGSAKRQPITEGVVRLLESLYIRRERL